MAQSPNNLIAFHSDRDGDWDIYVMNADGSGQRALTNNTVEDRDPVWSPDGRRIAFTSRPAGNVEIFVIAPDGSGLRRVTNHAAADFSPTFSPDGKRIAFVSDREDGQTDIYVVNVDGTGLRRLTTDPNDDWRPTWSPDGREIAFIAGRLAGNSDGSGEIFVIDSAGAKPDRQLLKQPRRVQFLDWSPDSTQLVYYMVGARRLEIGAANRDGTNERNLSAVASSEVDTEPVWSPDGKQIAFLAGTSSGTMGIFVMAADGSGRRLISTRDVPSTGPISWSADGGAVLHTQMTGGNWEVFVSPSDGGGSARRLTNHPAADQAATWPKKPLRAAMRSGSFR